MKIRYSWPMITQTLVWIPARVLLHVFTRITVTGKEHLRNIPPGVIFASNHMSEMDPIPIPAMLHPFHKHFPLFYVARSKGYYKSGKLKSSIYGGLFFKLLGAYPAYSGQHSYEKSLIHHVEILQKGKSVQIFPQGGKGIKTGTLDHEAHGGVAYLAWKTGCPIVPATLCGTRISSLWALLSFRRKYHLHFGRPINARDLFRHTDPQGDEYKQAAEMVMERIKELYTTHRGQ